MESMTKLDWFKQGVGLVIGLGISQIVFAVVDELVPQETVYQKVTVFVGRKAITMIIKDSIQDSVDARIDAIVNAVKKKIEEIDAAPVR